MRLSDAYDQSIHSQSGLNPSAQFYRALSGEVVGITDGDTITVLNNKTLKDVKIRLYGIDCPEGEQAFSKRARQLTSKMVYGKVVEVKVMATDRYG